MGIAVIGGLIVGSAWTLYVIPAMYVLLQRRSGRMSRTAVAIATAAAPLHDAGKETAQLLCQTLRVIADKRGCGNLPLLSADLARHRSIDDPFVTRDLRTTSGGCDTYANDRRPADSTFGARLRDVGTIVLG